MSRAKRNRSDRPRKRGKRPAAKAKLPPKAVCPLTAAQIVRLGELLDNKAANIYRVAESILERPLLDGEADLIYEAVEAAGWFKCEDCGLWLAKSLKATSDRDQCEECECEERDTPDESELE